MARELSVRRLSAPEWAKYRDLRLRALRESPDAFGSTLEQEASRPDSHWVARLAAGAESATDLPLIAETGPEPVGLAWGRVEPAQPEVARLYQMWVDPAFRRAGVGGALLAAAIHWASDIGARVMRLSATCGAIPAARLYDRAGFVRAGPPEPLRPGSAVLVQPLELELRAAPRDQS